jgi:post-segregation antitoxin (ccd killing protein)
MTLHIELPIDVETALLARAAAEGKDVSALITEAVTQRLATSESDVAEASAPAVRSSRGFAQRLQALIDLHPRTGGPADDSRESIYAGRGE